MKIKIVVSTLVVAMTAVTMAFAVDVVLKDGTVIKAARYTVNGSYVMIDLPTGAKVAYAVTDVDLAAMHRADEGPSTTTAHKRSAALPRGSLLLARAKSGVTSKFSITDKDVTHVETTTAGPRQKKAEGTKNGGGTVIVENVRVERGPAKGSWIVRGEVVNQMKKVTVTDVRVDLTATVAGAPPLPRANRQVAGSLGPGAKAPFSYTFVSPKKPQVTVQLHWLQPQAPPPAPKRIVPVQKTRPRTAQHPKQGPVALRWGGPPPVPPGVTPGAGGV